MKDKSKSRGRMRISYLFSADELGIAVPEPHTKRAIRIFLDLASDDEYSAKHSWWSSFSISPGGTF